MDELVAKCEELEIGLMPSLFWSWAVPDYFDEPYRIAWENPESKTRDFMEKYTREYVTRYKDSPAIYVWEFGNEKVLEADIFQPQSLPALPANSTRTSRNEDDCITLDTLNIIYTEFAKWVDESDPYDRMIGTGDTNPRSSQWNQYQSHGASFANDTHEQHEKVLEMYCPDGITAFSQHQYAKGDMIDPGDKTHPLLDYFDTWEGFFSYLVSHAKAMKKGCYAGEVGYVVSRDQKPMYKDITLEMVQKCFDAIRDAALKTKIPLVLWWNYDPVAKLLDPDGVFDEGTGVEFSFNEKMARGKDALETIKEINEGFAKMAEEQE